MCTGDPVRRAVWFMFRWWPTRTSRYWITMVSKDRHYLPALFQYPEKWVSWTGRTIRSDPSYHFAATTDQRWKDQTERRRYLQGKTHYLPRQLLPGSCQWYLWSAPAGIEYWCRTGGNETLLPKGLCCGAGGAPQMFKEEEKGNTRINSLSVRMRPSIPGQLLLLRP